MPKELNDLIAEVLLKHAAQIGQVTIQWNNVHHRIFTLYVMASGMPHQMATAAFFSLKTDTAQRDMAAAVCDHGLAEYPDIRARVGIIIDEVGKLSGKRNALVHTMWALDPIRGEMVPRGDIGFKMKAFRNNEKKLIELADEVGGKLQEHAYELFQLTHDFFERRSLPEIARAQEILRHAKSPAPGQTSALGDNPLRPSPSQE